VIQKIRDAYKNARVAILCPGPSVNEFGEKEDLAIAVNGAAFVSAKYDVFLTAYVKAPERDWWLASQNHSNKKNIVRMVSSYTAPFDPVLFPDEKTRLQLQRGLDETVREHEGDKYPYSSYVPDAEPKEPHLFFNFGGVGEEFISKISADQKEMYWGGTVAAIALQVALISGAERVILYGCQFNNQSGNNYHYKCPREQQGRHIDSQFIIMQKTVDRVRDLGLDVVIHGESALK